MRIAIDARYLNDTYSGIAKYSENLLTHLSLVDQENEYVVFIHPSFSRRLRVGENFSVERYPAPPVSSRTLFSFGRRVARRQCDFLHSLAPTAPLFGANRTILTIHDLQPFSVEETGAQAKNRPIRGRVSSFFHRATFPHFIRSATWLISVSQATKNRLSELFPGAEHKTIVVHSGVEEIFRHPPETAISQLACKKLALPPRYLLYIGTARPNKNIPRMLRVFARCGYDQPDLFGNLKFILALGSDRSSSECRRAIRDYRLENQVRILGPITEEEKRVLYARAEFLYSVTREEGFGLPIVEAQASGLPVLAGEDAAVPEITAGSALLANPNNDDDIASKLTRLLLDDDLRERLGKAGRANVARLSWRATAEKVLEVYNLLM